jgi:hypothetical protein
MAAPVARGEVASGFGSRSARARRAQDLARGRAPLTAVRPRLLRTGPGRGDRTGVRLPTANGESIGLGAGGRGLCFGHGRRGRLGAGGERRHHGGADGEREQTRGKLGNGHLTHPPSRPRCAKRAEGLWPLVAATRQKVHVERILPVNAAKFPEFLVRSSLRQASVRPGGMRSPAFAEGVWRRGRLER